MSSNVLDSYLVRLGATVDTASFTEFFGTIKRADTNITGFTIKSIAGFFKLEGAIVATFAAAGTSLIALADKTAMADQQYRLFGMRMLMTKDSARAMQMATEQLGATLDEIAYDPELNRRFQFLYEQNMKLSKSLGPGFDKEMRQMRDLRMEYKMFGNEIEFLGMNVISQVFSKLGYNSGEIEDKLRHFNEWFISNMPQLADIVSGKVIPVWNDFLVIMKDLGGLFKTAAGDFNYFTGVLTGDDSIKTTEFSIKNLVSATEDWLNVLAKLALTLQMFGKIAGHVFTGITADFEYMKQTLKGNFKAAAEAQAIGDRETKALKDDWRDFGSSGDQWRDNPDYSGIRDYSDRKNGYKYENRSVSPGFREMNFSSKSEINDLVKQVARDTGVSASLIYGQWAQETNGFTSNVMKKYNNMGGIRVPGTTEYEHYDSLQDFAKAYEKVISESRYTSQGILSTKTPEDFVHSLKSGAYFEGSEKDYAARVSQFSKDYDRGNSVQIQSVQINVPHALPQDQWHDFVRRSMTDITNKDNRNVMSQTAAGAYY